MTQHVCTCPDKGKYCKNPCACCMEEMLGEIDRLQLQARRFQVMARRLFRLALSMWKVKIELGEYSRAAGDAKCSTCGLKLFDHPDVEGFPTFVVTCDGRMWKL